MTAAEQMKRLTVAILVDPGNLARGGRTLIHGQADIHLVRALRRLAFRVIFGAPSTCRIRSRWIDT